ncbi:MAG: hypothetical protein GX458_11465 [Phyllobacteriaceae bacterium]|nr:hypothetical protein [Phyllobacteriaceae bacterium]
MRAAPVLLLGLIAVAVFGRAPSGEAPIRWTMRSGDAWMADWDGVRDVRLAAAAAAVHLAADQMPMALDGSPVVLEPKAPEPPMVVAAKPVVIDVKPIVVAEADLPPRDVPKQVPADAPEPETTGANPAAGASPDAVAPSLPRAHPTVNRTGKTDRLFSPAPFGRATEQEIFTRPTLAVVPPSQDGWPPVATIASLVAPQSEKALPRLALAPTATADGSVVVAMVRTGPGRVVTQSAIASLGERDRHAPRKGPIVLPPVPEGQVATLPPASRVWAQPDVPAIGYAKTTDVEYRFKSLLGDEEDQASPPKNPDDLLPP